MLLKGIGRIAPGALLPSHEREDAFKIQIEQQLQDVW